MDSDHGQKWWLMGSLAVRLVVSGADAAAFGPDRHPSSLHFAVVGIGPSAFSQTPTPCGRSAAGLAPMPLREFF